MEAGGRESQARGRTVRGGCLTELLYAEAVAEAVTLNQAAVVVVAAGGPWDEDGHQDRSQRRRRLRQAGGRSHRQIENSV